MPGLRFSKPTCRFCGRPWYPREFVRADIYCCDVCHGDREREARAAFGPARVFENARGERYIGVEPPAYLPTLTWD